MAFLFLTVYAAGTLYVALHHEPWRDEADAWLLVRDASLPTILSWTHNAGTPALWYAILKPLIWFNLPYAAETIVNLLIAWAAAAALVFLAPLTRLTKLLLLGSYFFAYEYAIIARSYSLTILFLFLAIAAFPRRPLGFAVAIALLCNTNVHGAVIAAILVLLWLRNRGWTPAALVTIAGGALIAALQLFPASSIGTVRNIRPYAIPTAIGDAFLPGAPVIIAVVVGLAVLATVAVAARGIFLLLTTGALIAIYTFIWFGGLRHSGLILIATVAAIWLARDVPATRVSRAAALLLNLSLLGSAAYASINSLDDVRWAFSGSREMATYIDHRFDDREIAAHNMFSAEALLPYLPGRRFWYAGIGQYGTYLNWNERQAAGAQTSYERAAANARNHFRGRKWLLLVNSPMPNPAQHGFRLIHATSVVVFRHLDERYWLYAPL